MGFKLLLFDVDGVLLSEERYFDASALTVWELLHSPNYLGQGEEEFTASPSEEMIRTIRARVFDHDLVLNVMKDRGINANWDMVYLAFCYQLILMLEGLDKKDHDFVKQVITHDITIQTIHDIRKKAHALNVTFTPNYSAFTDDFKKSDAKKQALLLYLNNIAKEKIGIKTTIFQRNSILWDICMEAFQEWYLGDEKIAQSLGHNALQPGKKGFLHDEIPIIPKEDMIQLFKTLNERGYQLGIGTGRPEIETIEPLQALGILQFFDSKRIITASDVLDAERKYPNYAPLAKPQPFAYVQGILGKNVPAIDAITTALPIDHGDDILIIGDSLADYYAAQAIGCRFAATLTGLSGQKARIEFEDCGADYILNDVSEILSILAE